MHKCNYTLKPAPQAKNWRTGLLASTALITLFAPSAFAQVVIHDGETSPTVTLNADGDSLTVEAGGEVNGGAAFGVLANSGNTNTVTNAGLIVTTAGGFSAIQLSNGTTATITNSGTITGVASGIGAGALFVNNIQGLINTSSGIIRGDANGIAINGFLANVSNAGLIEGTTGSGIIIGGGNLEAFTNQAGGRVLGATSGIAISSGDINNLTNAGVIRGEGDGANIKRGIRVNVGTITNLINTGDIIGHNTTGAAAGIGIEAFEIASLTNSGRIFGDLGVGSYAILETPGGGVDTELTLLPGSVIQGAIGISVGNDNHLNIGNGLNLATTFETELPENIDAHGMLLTTTEIAGISGLVATADTSVIAAQDNTLSDSTGAISGVLNEQVDMNYAQQDQNFWLKGFGGFTQTRTDGIAIGTNHFFGGIMTGADTMVSGGLQLGLFSGLSAGVLEVDIVNGQRVDSNSYFGGAYGQFNAENFYLNFGLTGGITSNNSERIVANNLVLGGLETATASYNSYFISPEVTIGTETIKLGDYNFKPSLRVRYGFMHSDDYVEIGTAGDLSVGARTTQVLDARLQLAMPFENLAPNTMFELRMGIDGRFVVANSEFDATLLGANTAGFNPGGAQSSVGGFIGADFSRALNDTATLFASTEVGMGTETLFRADAEVGVKVAF